MKRSKTTVLKTSVAGTSLVWLLGLAVVAPLPVFMGMSVPASAQTSGESSEQEAKPRSFLDRFRRSRAAPQDASDSGSNKDCDKLDGLDRAYCEKSGGRDMPELVTPIPTKSFGSHHLASRLWSPNTVPLSTDACSNGDFESGFSGWVGFRARHWMPGNSGNVGQHQTVVSPISNFLSNACDGNQSEKHCKKIVPSGSDPSLLSFIPNANMATSMSGNALRLGGTRLVDAPNNQWAPVAPGGPPAIASGKMAEGVARRFVVTPSNANYTFNYASVVDLVMLGPSNTHDSTEEAFFMVVAVKADGTIVDSFLEDGRSDNPFWTPSGQSTQVFNTVVGSNVSQPIAYRDWHSETLDLSSAIGDEVIVYMVNADCQHGGHWMHTYVDNVCAMSPSGDEGTITSLIGADGDDCLDEGETETITGSITLPPGATNVSVTLNLHQNGNSVPVGTLPTPIVTAAGYTLNVTRADFPGLDCYDIVATLTFSLPDMNGVVQQVTKTSSGAAGFEPDLNNDICLNCEPDNGGNTSGGGGGILDGAFTVPIDVDIFRPPGNDNAVDSTCCPPLEGGASIIELFDPQHQNGNATLPYRMVYNLAGQPVADLNARMQAYIDYLNAINPSVTSITLNFRVYDQGPVGSPPPTGNGTQVHPDEFITWTAGGSGSPSNGGGNFWLTYDQQPNRNYGYQVGMFLNDEIEMFPEDCSIVRAGTAWAYWISAPGPDGGGTAVTAMRVSTDGGEVVETYRNEVKLDAAQYRKLKAARVPVGDPAKRSSRR